MSSWTKLLTLGFAGGLLITTGASSFASENLDKNSSPVAYAGFSIGFDTGYGEVEFEFEDDGGDDDHSGVTPRRRNPAPRERVRRTVPRQHYNRAEAMRIQTALNTLGYDVGVVDGVIGPATRGGIRAFQIEIDENPTGVLTATQKIILYDRASLAEAARDQDNEDVPEFDGDEEDDEDFADFDDEDDDDEDDDV